MTIPRAVLDRTARRAHADAWTAVSPAGMVATAHYLATRAGAEILGAGGNAFDAAAAVSFALGVCDPAGSGLGGMALAVAHRRGRTFTVEGPCLAPARATPDAVAASPRKRGYRAVAVPTHAAVARHLLERYGTLGAADVLAPAIRIAEEGFHVSPTQAAVWRTYAPQMREQPGGALFLGSDGGPLRFGDVLRQPALARTLRRLASAGLADFHEGEIAARIAADMARRGGFVTAADLAAVRVTEDDPLALDWRGLRVLTLPPPGGGLTLLEMLSLHAALDGREADPDTPEGVVRLARIVRRARRDRIRLRLALRRGAPEPARLLEPTYARSVLAEMDGETSHACVVDGEGNAVSLTQSIERSFGAQVATPSLGFLYNGYLQAFKVRGREHPHYLRPGTPARSNAAPTLLLRDGRVHAIVGSTGSERLASGVCGVLVRLALGRSPFDAVHAPRLHCTPKGRVLYEGGRLARPLLDALAAAGLTLEPHGPYSFRFGGLQLVVRGEGEWVGVGEVRRDGYAAGPGRADA